MTEKRRAWLLSATLAAAVIAAYWKVGACGFVTIDDPGYVSEEPMVSYGLRPASLQWALAVPHGGNWHPLTSLSHMLDCDLFGVVPGPMHWENVALHAVNAVLVFIVWRELTGALWPSALVAALFALHPLHVESVAWISERKDVLSTFFWLLGIGAYVRWVRSPSRGGYLWMLLLLVLGLLAKPMVVTFPCTLLLLDFWPLRRWPECRVRQLVGEKIPLLVLVGAFSVTTYLVQRSVGAGEYGEHLSIGARVGNAIVSYARYLGKTFWPESLAVSYPHPGYWPWRSILGALALLGAVTALAVRQAASRPWLIFGWLWFLGTLVPVIGLAQVGRQAMADRYTYVPLLGIFTLIAWAGAELATRLPPLRMPLVGAASFALLGCFFATQRQVLVWRDGVSLFEHALMVTNGNAFNQMSYADALTTAGRPSAEVIAQYQSVLELQPDCFEAISEIAKIAATEQRYEEARALLTRVRVLRPIDANTLHNLALVANWQGRADEAITFLQESLRLRPDNGPTLRELARICFRQGRPDEARTLLETAIRADRWDFLAFEKLGIVLATEGRAGKSRACFEQALWINPGAAEARAALHR